MPLSKKKAQGAVASKSRRTKTKTREIAKEGGSARADSVDALFADVAGPSDDDAAASDASSAGAFQDVDDDAGSEDDAGLPDLDSLTAPGAAAAHEEELKVLKEKDPEFYRFLVAEDKQLLDFHVDPEEEDKAGEEQEERGATPAGVRVLTVERYHRIQETAKTSFTACKAALNAFHAAVRSIEGGATEAQEEDMDDAESAKAAAKKQREGKGVFHIQDEALFSEVLEWSVANLLGLFKLHAGALRVGGTKKKMGRLQKNKAADAAVVDPSQYERWSRVKVLVQIFWDETFYLLRHLVAPHMLEFVLRACSTPEALSWLWPYKGHRQRFFKQCSSLWSTSTSHRVRMLAFLFIRNSGAMAIAVPDSELTKGMPQLEAMIRTVLKSFAEVASWGYSWRSLSTFRFMENCLIELLALDDATSYRIGYVCLRQLAVIFRNSCLPVAPNTAAKKEKAKSKANERQEAKVKEAKEPGAGDGRAKPKKGKQAAQQLQTLVGWPFVRSLYLWTKAVGTVPSLKPLSYPLYMITTGALKSKLTNLQHFPFVYHCFQCLNRLGAALEVFVPMSSHVLKVCTVLLQALDKSHKSHRKPKVAPSNDDAQPKAELSTTKAPDVEILLRFSEGQVGESLTLEAVGNSLSFVLLDHLGLLSQSPAFPEISAPVAMHLKRFSKRCQSESFRQQLKHLVSNADESADEVRSRREAFTERPAVNKFLIWEADTTLGKVRAAAIQRRASEEKTRVEAEVREEKKPIRKTVFDDDVEEGESAPGFGNSRKAKKRRRARTLQDSKPSVLVETVDESGVSVRKKKLRKKDMGPAGKDDLVEEMVFS